MDIAEQARHRSATQRDQRRVSIVDQDDIDRSVLQFMLADDHDTTDFDSIDAAEGHPHWPVDLVIVAATLVANNGPHLIARWRVLWPDMKIMVICEACGDDSVLAALHAGADATLARPFHMEAVRKKVEHALRDGLDFRQSMPLPDAALAPELHKH